MLVIPSSGFETSVDKHNVSVQTVCDWIEASIIFAETELSQMDIVDVLLEEMVYVDQDFAWELVDTCWAELQRRAKWAGQSCAYTVEAKRLVKSGDWEDQPAFAFCVVLSLARVYSWWHKAFGADYTEQGELFECLAQHSLEAQLGDWRFHRTGWAKNHTTSLRTLADAVATRLCGQTGDVAVWEGGKAKDLGADILGIRPFRDNRSGFPAYLIQCASGGNWSQKLGTPNLDEWVTLIRVDVPPAKAFAVPFSLDEDEFRRSVISTRGLFIDRNRLLMAESAGENWLPLEIRDRMKEWLQPRVAKLLEMSR